jgi:hypothetical protein
MIRSIARHRNKVHTFEIIFQFFKSPRSINIGNVCDCGVQYDRHIYLHKQSSRIRLLMPPVCENSLSYILTDLTGSEFLCFFAWRWVLSKASHHSLLEKFELTHCTFYYSVSSEWTNRINGNSAFNESLKLYFRFFGNMLYRKGGRRYLSKTRPLH